MRASPGLRRRVEVGTRVTTRSFVPMSQRPETKTPETHPDHHTVGRTFSPDSS